MRGLVVVALSIAVWAFAEARSLTTSTQTVTIVLTAPTGSDVTAWLASTSVRRETVTLRIEGSRAALQRTGQRLGEPVELVVGESLPTEPGTSIVSLRDALRDHRVFDRLAVSLVDVQPATLDVVVDEQVRQTFPVRVRTDGFALASPPVAEPASITVIGPASIVRSVTAEALEATAPRQELAELTAGSTAQISGMPIVIPEIWRNELVRVNPSSVSATITLRDTIERHEMSSVPVMVRLSPTQLRQWSVRIAPENAYLRDVVVSGPGEAIDAIRSGRQRVVATVQLESVELTAGEAEYRAVLSTNAGGVLFEVSDDAVAVVISEIEEAGESDTGQ